MGHKCISVAIEVKTDDDLELNEGLRLITIDKWPDFGGYGFNLHEERGKPGHFIGNVEEHSPAQAAGLKVGDHIFEVNGMSIRNDDHGTVISRITSDPEQVVMLVAQPYVGDQYLEKQVWPHSRLQGIRVLTSHDSTEGKDGGQLDIACRCLSVLIMLAEEGNR